MGADFEPAVLFADALAAFDFCARCGVEIAFDIGMQRRLVVLTANRVGAGIENVVGDVGMTAHGIDRDQRAFKIDALDECRNGGDLVDFAATACWPSTSRRVVAKAETRCSALRPFLRSWLRREVLPSMATRSGRSGQQAATHDEKQAANRSGSTRFMTVRSQSAHGIPW
jgi:hypothetical protein